MSRNIKTILWIALGYIVGGIMMLLLLWSRIQW